MADLVSQATLDDLVNAVTGRTKKTIDDLYCQLSVQDGRKMPAYLLFFIAAKLVDFGKSVSFGSNYFRISPYTLTTEPVLILDLEPAGLVRKVSLAIDLATGGPAPSIRLSTGASNSGSGVQLTPGQFNEIGEIEPKTKLYAASTANVNCYVVERA